MDALQAKEQRWVLEIRALGMAVGDLPPSVSLADTYAKCPKGLPYLVSNSGFMVGYNFNIPEIDPEALNHLIERVMTGDELSYKALYLMVYNDPERYSEWRQLVESLKPTIEQYYKELVEKTFEPIADIVSAPTLFNG
jgi:hypothetical protein